MTRQILSRLGQFILVLFAVTFFSFSLVYLAPGDAAELVLSLQGGERQRVGIARVMLMDPDVIVMDEPTSSLDVFNEKRLLKTLDNEYPDKTILIVSHRRSTLNGCDRLLRLRSGELEEVGGTGAASGKEPEVV